MINGDFVVGAIISQLKEPKNYPDTKVYRERQTQNTVRPSFFVSQLQLSQEKRMDKRYTRMYRIKISWLPPKGEELPRVACEEVGNRLLGIFRLVSVPGRPVRPSFMEYEVIDDELRFTMDIPIFAEWQDDPVPDMLIKEVNVYPRQ